MLSFEMSFFFVPSFMLLLVLLSMRLSHSSLHPFVRLFEVLMLMLASSQNQVKDCSSELVELSCTKVNIVHLVS